MKIVQQEKDGRGKSNALLVVEKAQISEIWKEFFPQWIVKEGGDWICPICRRPHHKEPGPFTRGVTIRTQDRDYYNESTVTLWVQSLGCCRWEKSFPLKEIRERKLKASNFIPVLT